MRRYEALVSFEKVYAPFNGVITARNTDIGDLINSGSSTAPRTDLFHMVQTRTLRVYVNVPEEYSQGVKVGETQADIVSGGIPRQEIPRQVGANGRCDQRHHAHLAGRNGCSKPSGTLFSGSYAEVHLKVPSQKSTFLIPVNTLIFRSEKLQVGVVQEWESDGHRRYSRP